MAPRVCSSVLISAVFLAMFAAPVHGQQPETWVSSGGSDFNNCSRSAPCASLGTAAFYTIAGGELHCVDSQVFDSFSIAKSITIDCGGTSAFVLGDIFISAGPSDVVTIRNLNIEGESNFNFYNFGIVYFSAQTVHIENVSIQNTFFYCIDVEATGNAELTVENSTLDNCAYAGIRTTTTTGSTVVADIHNTRISKSGNGINAQNGSRISVRDAEITFCNPGINESGLSGGGAVVTVEGSTLALNGTAGLQSVGGGTITAFHNVFSGNALMFNTNGGQIFTGGDNASLATDSVGSTSGGASRQ